MSSPPASRSQLASDALLGHYAGVTTFSEPELNALIGMVREAVGGKADEI